MRALVAVILGITLLAACDRRPPAPRGGAVPIAPGLTLTLPRPGDLRRVLEARQLVTARYGTQTVVFESHLSAEADRLVVVALDTLGRRALTVTWTDVGIETERAEWLPTQVRAEHMLADLVILYWPEDVVREALALSGGRLVSVSGSRSVLAGDQEVARAEYEPSQGDPWSGRLRYRHFAWDYELEIRSVEARP